MGTFRYAAALFAFAVLAPVAHAQHGTRVYKCVDASGQVSFQDKPCPRRDSQSTLHLDAPSPMSSTPPPAAPSPPAAKATASTPQPAAPAPQHDIPVLYACRRATDGKRYISRNGQPRPYKAPLGMLGLPPRSLSEDIGGAVTPHQQRAQHRAARIAGYYTTVRDRCRQLSIPATCRALRREHDAIEGQIRKAFESDRPPLEQREKALRSDLSGCR